MEARLTRRVLGVLVARLPESQLWLDLLRWFYNAVISASDHDVFALRARALAMPP